MNHLAFDVPAEKMDEYLVKLRAKGVAVTEITNHANSLDRRPQGRLRRGDRQRRRVRALDVLQGSQRHPLEFAAWTTTFDESDIAHQRQDGRRQHRSAQPSRPDASAGRRVPVARRPARSSAGNHQHRRASAAEPSPPDTRERAGGGHRPTRVTQAEQGEDEMARWGRWLLAASLVQRRRRAAATMTTTRRRGDVRRLVTRWPLRGDATGATAAGHPTRPTRPTRPLAPDATARTGRRTDATDATDATRRRSSATRRRWTRRHAAHRDVRHPARGTRRRRRAATRSRPGPRLRPARAHRTRRLAGPRAWPSRGSTRRDGTALTFHLRDGVTFQDGRRSTRRP